MSNSIRARRSISLRLFSVISRWKRLVLDVSGLKPKDAGRTMTMDEGSCWLTFVVYISRGCAPGRELSDGDRIRFELEVQNSVSVTQFLPRSPSLISPESRRLFDVFFDVFEKHYGFAPIHNPVVVG